MKTILIILLMAAAGGVKAQDVNKAISDMIDARIKGISRDTVLYVGTGIILDTANGKATLRIDPAYIAKPLDINTLLTLIRTVTTVTTTQRNLLKVAEGYWIYNSTTHTYQKFTGGVWK